MSDEISFRPIGIVHTKASIDDIRAHSLVDSVVEIYPEFEEGLDGIENFSHIFVIGYFNQLRSEQIGPLKVRPKGLTRFGIKLEDLPLIGVFALDSPTRPNPIGLSLVELRRREGNKLFVYGLDYFDKTPVLDIKPYQASYHVQNFAAPDWHARLLKAAGRT